MKNPKIIVQRIYELPAHKEGLWFLVDRLWPRGIKKAAIPFDDWLKDIAPSTELRQWFHQDRNNWFEFKQRYLQELESKQQLVDYILEKAQQQLVTLLYASKDKQHNHAIVLQEYLLAQVK